MKTVRLQNNIVKEIIPLYALPVEEWYGAEFAASCVAAPDEVGERWTYDAETGEFRAPQPQEPPAPPEPTETQQLRADIDFLAIMTGVNL